MYWITGLIGLGSVVAPFLFGFDNETAALWTSVGVGVVLMAVSGFELLAHDRDVWEYWVAGIVGLTALAAPFVLNFAHVSEAMWTGIVVGVLTVLVVGYRLTTQQQIT